MSTQETTKRLPSNPVHIWWLAARPKTLVAALVPVLVGTAFAYVDGEMAISAAIAALLGAIGIQIGTNLANDLFDFRRGADTEERLGPMRVTQAGLLTQRQVAVGTAVAFVMAFGCGLYLATFVGWPLIVLGLVCILSGIAYTAGPYPLAYIGLGDVFVFVFFGLVATVGTYWVQTGGLSLACGVAAVAVGVLATALIVVNNLRDIDGDRKVNKKTLAVRIGARASVWQYRVLLVVGYGEPVALFVADWASAWVFLPLLTLPLAARCMRDIAALKGAALNGLLARTAQLQLLFGLLFTVGVVL